MSSAILYDIDNAKGYIINSNYASLSGGGYDMDYEVRTGGLTFDEVISVCSYASFELIYNWKLNTVLWLEKLLLIISVYPAMK